MDDPREEAIRRVVEAGWQGVAIVPLTQFDGRWTVIAWQIEKRDRPYMTSVGDGGSILEVMPKNDLIIHLKLARRPLLDPASASI